MIRQTVADGCDGLCILLAAFEDQCAQGKVPNDDAVQLLRERIIGFFIP